MCVVCVCVCVCVCVFDAEHLVFVLLLCSLPPCPQYCCPSKASIPLDLHYPHQRSPSCHRADDPCCRKRRRPSTKAQKMEESGESPEKTPRAIQQRGPRPGLLLESSNSLHLGSCLTDLAFINNHQTTTVFPFMTPAWNVAHCH